ncbi:MAG: acetate--CoA ligase family protein [Syntrophaceae bacterium]
MFNPLQSIMAPSSIAIVGASNNATKMGTIQCLNLIHSGFKGDILPVHPKEKIVLGKTAYQSIEKLPYAPELAVLVVPTALVPGMLEHFGRLGTRFAVIITAGFKETGGKGLALEEEVNRIAEEYGIRFLGPNCLGIINTWLPLNMTVTPVADHQGKLSLASQSGTYVAQTLPYLHRHGIALSKAISVGNEANIDIVDCLEYLGADESTKAIGLYIEGIRRASRFLEVARAVSRKKPIVAQYVGGTEAGARSGSSHTGAMAGPDYVYDGLFEQAGIIRVDTIEEVYKIGWALASQPPLKGKRIAILTNSGGPGTAMAMTCNKYGLEVPEFSPQVQAKVAKHIPGHASPRNPVDLTFHVEMGAITRDIPTVLMQAPEIDGLIIHGIMDTGFFKVIYPMIKDLVGLPQEQFIEMVKLDLDPLTAMPFAYGKPLMISSFFDHGDHAIESFHARGIPVFDSPEKAAKAMAALYKYHQANGMPPALPEPRDIPPKASKLVESTAVFDEYSAKQLLRTYGIPTVHEALAHTLEEALEAVNHIGYPVVLKVCDPHIQHKTEQGLVKLDIKNAQELMKAFRSLRRKAPHAPILVAQMLKGEKEFMAGVNSYPGFPPCVLFGLGGIFTEALKDFSIRLAPLSPYDAQTMMEAIRARALLGAYRGMTAVDAKAMADLLIALSFLALHFPQIAEIDLNPIIVVNGAPKVADALIVKRAPQE